MLGTIPQFSEAVANDRLETVGWSLSTQLIEHKGYWQQGNQNRTDWHEAPSNDMIQSVGLEAAEDGISTAKIEAMQEMEYTTVKNIVNIKQNFNLELTEFKIVSTDSTFEKGSPPWAIDDITYEGNSDTVWYGATSERGASYYFFIDRDPAYTIYVSENRDFSSYETIEQSQGTVLDFGPKSFTLNHESSGISQAEGKQLVLERYLGRIGGRTPPEQAQTVQLDRFSWIGSNPVRIGMEVWD